MNSITMPILLAFISPVSMFAGPAVLPPMIAWVIGLSALGVALYLMVVREEQLVRSRRAAGN